MADLVDPTFEVDGVQCKSKKDVVTVGVGLPRSVQFAVKMRCGEHRVDAVKRKSAQLAVAVAHMTSESCARLASCPSYFAINSFAPAAGRGTTAPKPMHSPFDHRARSHRITDASGSTQQEGSAGDADSAGVLPSASRHPTPAPATRPPARAPPARVSGRFRPPLSKCAKSLTGTSSGAAANAHPQPAADDMEADGAHLARLKHRRSNPRALA